MFLDFVPHNFHRLKGLSRIKLLWGFGVGSGGGLRAAQAARAAERAKPEQHFGNGGGLVILHSADLAAVSLARDRIRPAAKRFFALDFGANPDDWRAQLNPVADLPTLSERANALVVRTLINIVFNRPGHSPHSSKRSAGATQALELADIPVPVAPARFRLLDTLQSF